MHRPSRLSVLRRAALALVLVAGAVPACAQETTADGASEVVLIPSRVIYPGETIDLAALKQVTLAPGKHRPDAVATLARELEGKVAKRTLLPGRYIPTNAVREAWLVEQGASVQMFFVAGGLTISATAVTLQPGAAGDQVKVRNVDSGKIISGTVMADGTIRVGAS
ncbi:MULTISPECIES: flagellar basal body P-ring formation chaperone FlgA [unclassified Mesorhizobium]|uniref:flagellar basal body P-ring formation chaperone FlgA n=1 Tax=unclassified Mesorhizobium TaxID=325217 RepID=UPI00095B9056|nr:MULTISPECIES: flagellar basal body P-ring formation chaperone FlgA [unclassified Mesorhizobium]MBN9254730.1 flagellar basal body P-ring formation protein FlgA [Mesorhizobium sp.]MBN9268660.1 flagellar basal body P-ring formation protein FlgA [Mesorhizobium sp.]OJX75087.1 MAG: flagella basal body P-ring formation protein FlgA [Mesorhizobium sp. 65-26]